MMFGKIKHGGSSLQSSSYMHTAAVLQICLAATAGDVCTSCHAALCSQSAGSAASRFEMKESGLLGAIIICEQGFVHVSLGTHPVL